MRGQTVELSRVRVGSELGSYRAALYPSEFLASNAGDDGRDEGVQPFAHIGAEMLDLIRLSTTTSKWEYIASTAFGVTGAEAAEAIRAMDRHGWPSITVVEANVLRGASAAYAAASDTILISRELLTAGAHDPQALQTAILEELGHAIDARLHVTDAPGDEGAIFCALVRGETLSADTLTGLKGEDDHGVINLAGTPVKVEFAGTYGSITVDGSLTDWSAADRIDIALGTIGYEIYGKNTGNAFVFAIKAPVVIGAGTTAWLNTDLNSATGYQIFGFAGGVEYNVNFDAAGTARLYSGAAGQTLLGTVDYTYSADRKVVEFAVPTALIGSPTALGAFFDVNNSVYLSSDYSNAQYIVGPPTGSTPAAVVGTVTLDGVLSEWTAANRIDTALGAVGYEIYARVDGDAYIFAMKAPILIGANTTAWLNTDLNAATGYKIFGFAGGAEYNVNFNAAGAPALYSGAAGQTLIGSLQYGFSADHKSVEFAVPKSLIGSPAALGSLFDVNNSIYLPGDYSAAQYMVSSATGAPVVGGVTLDGSLADWTAAMRIDNGSVPAGYEIYGRVAGDSFIVALKATSAIGANTTAWLNTDQNAATGFKVFGASGGAEFNVNFNALSKPALYTGDAGQTAVVGGENLLHGFSADHQTVEFAVPKSLLGSPIELDMIFDFNNAVFLPTNFVGAQYEIVDTPQLPVVTESSKRVAIVYSETSANAYFSTTAYSQLFMAAQNQAVAAGVPFDVINETDLTSIATLAKYDAIVFPSFRNVAADKVGAIENTLELAVEQYHIGLIAAGDFMTNDATGAVLPGDPYGRMKAFFDLTREGGGSGPTVITAATASHPVMSGYAIGETIRSYGAVSYSFFQDATPGVTAPTVLATETTAGQTHSAVVATGANGARNVHFATEGFLGDSNQLQHAIQWSVNGAGITGGLQLSREASVFASRNDMDQSMFTDDVTPLGPNGQILPGIYDTLLPLISQWKEAYNFVSSYYINVGDQPGIGQVTDWARSLPYYQAILALGNEIGSHSMTHLANLNPTENTNILTQGTGPGSFDYEFNQSKIIIDQQIGALVPGFSVIGAAVPGAPELLATAKQIIQYYNYLSGGYAGVGAGYPGAIGYLTPDSNKVYIAPNIKFDFTLVQFNGLTPAQALVEWNKEMADIASHADVPIFVWPWHDYAATAWTTPGDAAASPYTTQLFTSFIASAAGAGAEFVTLEDLARRYAALEKATIDYTVTGNIVNASVISSDAGKFAFDLDALGTQKIASVANWYAYDDDSVFLPRNGGNFTITLAANAVDVAHIVKLPARAELVSLTGDGTNLSFTLIGEGKVVIDLKNQPGAALNVTGATIVSQSGDILTLDVGVIGQHTVTVTHQAVSPPVITSNGGGDTAAVSLAENLAAVTTVVASVSNPNLSRTFSIGGGADAALFVINATSGALAFLAPPDFETPADVGANNVYDVRVVVTDSLGRSDTQAIAVTITNIAGVTRTGTAAADILTGTSEEDTINGAGGSDTLNGLGGNDTLNGGTGADTMIGGTGNDSYVVDNTGDVVTEAAGEGTDLVRSSITYSLTANVENLSLTGSTNINGLGNALDNVLNGNSGANVLTGGGGNDTISGAGGSDTLDGGDGNDILNGDAGVDTLSGGAGNDRLDGGAGFDMLFGGAGNDTFIFRAVAQIGSGTTLGRRDAINDFIHGEDTIDLSAIDANTTATAAGDQAFNLLETAGAAFTAAGQIRILYTTIDGVEHTIIEGNVDANLATDFRIDLLGHIDITANDFIF